MFSSYKPISWASLPEPRPSLRSVEIKTLTKDLLHENFFTPDYEFVAFRITSFNQDQDILQNRWENIVFEREQLDEYVLQMVPGIEVLFSSITATQSIVRKAQGEGKDRFIYPGIAYWIVLKAGCRDMRMLCDKMQSNPFGGNLKILLQPHQTSAKEISAALHTVLKDTTQGCVPHIVQHNAGHHIPDSASTVHSAPPSIVKVYALTNENLEVLTSAQEALKRYKLPIQIFQI